MDLNNHPLQKFEDNFCKVIIRTNNGDKSLKGNISIFDRFIQIKGDFQTTVVAIDDIKRITTKEHNESIS